MSAIYFKTEEEISHIRTSCKLVGQTLAELAKHIYPGISTIRLDEIAEEFIRDHNGIPSFKGYKGFPRNVCISLNEEVVHGIPNERTLEEGDIVSIDCGVLFNGFHGDSAYTFPVGDISKEKRQLMKVTEESLYKAIDEAVAGKRVGDISFAVQNYVENLGYSVVRELVGHGVGRTLHEKPEVPNYGKKGNGTMLKEGMVIAIEPMVNMGKKDVVTEEDGWTVTTEDEMPSAHYEHTVAVRKGKADILSTFKYIEEVLNEKQLVFA